MSLPCLLFDLRHRLGKQYEGDVGGKYREHQPRQAKEKYTTQLTEGRPLEGEHLFQGLVGENGAGKSILMKVLAGIYQADRGEIFYNGERVSFRNPKEAQDAGIAIVHQELNLMNHLTAAQNIFIGREGTSFFVNDETINQKTRRLFERIRMDISPTEKVGNLTVGKQQMVEIVKAISFNAKILILDEPTAALTKTEVVELFNVMKDLKAHGAQ